MDDLEQMEEAEKNLQELKKRLEYEKEAYKRNFIGEFQFEKATQDLINEYEFEMRIVDSVKSRLADGAYFTGDPDVDEALKTDATRYASEITQLITELTDELDISIKEEHKYISGEKIPLEEAHRQNDTY
jgi:sugar-specific transcriptional regulator TrmB